MWAPSKMWLFDHPSNGSSLWGLSTLFCEEITDFVSFNSLFAVSCQLSLFVCLYLIIFQHIVFKRPVLLGKWFPRDLDPSVNYSDQFYLAYETTDHIWGCCMTISNWISKSCLTSSIPICLVLLPLQQGVS